MNYEITIDNLTVFSVSVKKQNYMEIEGIKYYVGEPSRVAYNNSAQGRSFLSEEVDDPYYSAIMAVWGDHPIVEVV